MGKRKPKPAGQAVDDFVRRCTNCAKRKIKCDGRRPCEQCLASTNYKDTPCVSDPNHKCNWAPSKKLMRRNTLDLEKCKYEFNLNQSKLLQSPYLQTGDQVNGSRSGFGEVYHRQTPEHKQAISRSARGQAERIADLNEKFGARYHRKAEHERESQEPARAEAEQGWYYGNQHSTLQRPTLENEHTFSGLARTETEQDWYFGNEDSALQHPTLGNEPTLSESAPVETDQGSYTGTRSSALPRFPFGYGQPPSESAHEHFGDDCCDGNQSSAFPHPTLAYGQTVPEFAREQPLSDRYTGEQNDPHRPQNLEERKGAQYYAQLIEDNLRAAAECPCLLAEEIARGDFDDVMEPNLAGLRFINQRLADKMGWPPFESAAGIAEMEGLLSDTEKQCLSHEQDMWLADVDNLPLLLRSQLEPTPEDDSRPKKKARTSESVHGSPIDANTGSATPSEPEMTGRVSGDGLGMDSKGSEDEVMMIPTSPAQLPALASAPSSMKTDSSDRTSFKRMRYPTVAQDSEPSQPLIQTASPSTTPLKILANPSSGLAALPTKPSASVHDPLPTNESYGAYLFHPQTVQYAWSTLNKAKESERKLHFKITEVSHHQHGQMIKVTGPYNSGVRDWVQQRFPIGREYRCNQ